MSLLIKGLNMPKDCESCNVAHLADCELWMKAGYRQIHKDCPLVEVPTPHGRLIDASAKIEVEMYDEEWSVTTMMVSDLLTSAAEMPPTIIEAEEAEEGEER